ncbi:hypothetical protein [Actinotignum sp. GS-2025c]
MLWSIRRYSLDNCHLNASISFFGDGAQLETFGVTRDSGESQLV